MSSTYWPVPVMKRWSSLRRTDAPMPWAVMDASRFLFRSLLGAAHPGRTGHNGAHDVVVARASTEIALELLADDVLAHVRAFAQHDIDAGHDHAGRAEAALQRVMLTKRRLHRV